MEKQLFSWEEFDPISDYTLNFYICILKKDIGEYKEGTHIDCIGVDYEKGRLQIHNNGEIETQFELKLEIGDQIPLEEKD